MLEQLQYINHIGEVLEFGKNNLFANENDLRNFTWQVISKNDRISGFKKGIVNKTIPLILKCTSATEGIALKNKLFEVFEKDVLAAEHGRLVIGDYYFKCFVIESEKNNYLLDSSYLTVKVKLVSDFPYWVRETITPFSGGNNAVGVDLDYNRDYAYDYASNTLGDKLNNTHFVGSNFKLNIYGECSNPVITIGGHDYGVNTTIGVNEYLTIDSIDKTIILTHENGTKENLFNKRNKESYIFEKIPAGLVDVSANAAFEFDVILLEERSEPRWT